MKVILGTLALAILALSVTSCATSSQGCTSCAQMMAKGSGWCEGCNKGMVDGKEVKCASCYKGKTGEATWCASCKKGYVGGESMKCKGCFEAKKVGGTCMDCKK